LKNTADVAKQALRRDKQALRKNGET
jgi:hypothetical protein